MFLILYLLFLKLLYIRVYILINYNTYSSKDIALNKINKVILFKNNLNYYSSKS